MSKIHLVLVDKEKDYLEAVIDYILNNHSNRYRVSSFSKISFLEKFLLQTDQKIDVLLINESMYDESFSTKRIGIIILLTSSMTNDRSKDIHKIYKYQAGNEIIKAIIKILSQDQDREVYLQSYDTKTKSVAVFSPSGGVGKTSISLVSSTLCSYTGYTTLYLNFEPFQSTSSFFDCNEEESLSEIFYYIKNKSKNLSLRIEGVISTDTMSKVHYISPPESIIDINECTDEEVDIFIENIRLLNKYDYVFIDMSSSLDKKNISILSKSDHILMVITQDDLSISKAKLFLKDLEILSKRLGDTLIDKVSIIINKYNNKSPINIEDLGFYKRKIHLKIPKVPRIFIPEEGLYRVDMESEFAIRLKEYVNHFIRR